MDDDVEEQLEEATDEPPMEEVAVDLTADVMPSLGDQMDEAGKGVTDMRMGLVEADHPETGEPIGELLVGVQGALWFETDEGPRVRIEPRELIVTCLRMVGESEYGPDETVEEDDG